MHGRIMRASIAFVVVWLAFDRAANALGSTRGERGLAVCALVLGSLYLIQRGVFAQKDTVRSLGLRRPQLQVTGVVGLLMLVLLCFFPAYSALMNVAVTWRSDAWLLACGMFLQGGVAEETLFRGFLFAHLRQGRSFWRGAWLSAIPFTLVHCMLFITLDWPVALAALALALAISFPLSWVYERSGASIWPCALLHASIQAPIKLVEVPEPAFAGMAVTWMALTATLPWLVFVLCRPHPRQALSTPELAPADDPV